MCSKNKKIDNEDCENLILNTAGYFMPEKHVRCLELAGFNIESRLITERSYSRPHVIDRFDINLNGLKDFFIGIKKANLILRLINDSEYNNEKIELQITIAYEPVHTEYSVTFYANYFGGLRMYWRFYCLNELKRISDELKKGGYIAMEEPDIGVYVL